MSYAVPLLEAVALCVVGLFWDEGASVCFQLLDCSSVFLDSVVPGMQRLLTGVFFAILYAVLNQYYPLTLVLSESFSVSYLPVCCY